MTTLEDARATVEEYLAALSTRTNIDLAVDEAATRSEPWCWIFFYTSRAHLETGSFRHALAGNGPLVVERDTGRLHELGTARPVDEQLEELRRTVEREPRRPSAVPAVGL